ncbi:MAG: ABC transporter ATP-binding protein/permease [Eubacterium sp.]|nr:ABC transporter ATP-binding protein/permease [Eubacterium sp.]
MGWVPVKSDIKVPIWKNILYAFKILYSCSKSYMVWHIIDLLSYTLFNSFFRGILFLKVLLGIIEKNMDFTYYIKNLVLFLLCGLFYEFISVYSDYKTLVGEKKMLKALNNRIFKKAAEVDISCYEDPVFYDKYQRASEILTGGYFSAYAYAVSSVISNLIAFISVISIVASIHFTYLLFLLPIALVFLIEVAKSKVVYKRDFSMTTNNRIKAYTQRIVFLRDYAKDIRTSNIFSVILSRFNKAVTSNIKILKSYGVKLFIFSMVSSLFGEFIPIIGTYAFAGYQFIYTNSLSVSGFSVVLSSIYSVRSTTEMMANEFAELSAVALYFQNLREFFEYESKVVSGEKEPEEFESLEFKNVYFKYPSAEKYSLQNVNIKIEKGQTVAVVGVNGAGKTTFVKLLLRFYDVTSGEILYNGINIKEYKLESLRLKFATVFQDYKTFALSVNENIMCRNCSNEDKLTAEKALKQSGVYDKIRTLKNGADTVLTREFDENGAGLSGGEAQKTAVARMFASGFDVAILDEPSSALDPIAEYKMYETLIQATKNKTVIYISHRLSSAVLSDNIFVLGNGTVIESGAHNELMAGNGEYAKMFNLQASSYKKREGEDYEEN